MSYRLAFVTSHPIQYQVPVFRELAQRSEINLTVLFAHIPDGQAQGVGFGIDFEWDIPLLDGYDYRVMKNVARSPSVTHYAGCDTPELFQVLRQEAFDAVIVNGWVVKSCIQALRASIRAGVPCLVRGEANHLRPRPWWKKAIQRSLIRRYAGYLYIGEANRRFYESYGAKPEQLFPARYCIESERFAAAVAAPALRDRLRRRYAIPDDAVCFMYSGKFEQKKHPVELVEAFGNAVRRGATSHLLMVGDGHFHSTCEQRAANLGLPIHFAGFVNQSQMPATYLASDCLVLPSDHGETWGLVVNEAMACGRPAIVSDQVGCHEDLVTDGTTGAVFPFGDWGRLTELLVRYSQQADDLQTMGERARQRIQVYSPTAAADGIVEAVKYVASDQPRGI